MANWIIALALICVAVLVFDDSVPPALKGETYSVIMEDGTTYSGLHWQGSNIKGNVFFTPDSLIFVPHGTYVVVEERVLDFPRSPEPRVGNDSTRVAP